MNAHTTPSESAKSNSRSLIMVLSGELAPLLETSPECDAVNCQTNTETKHITGEHVHRCPSEKMMPPTKPMASAIKYTPAAMMKSAIESQLRKLLAHHLSEKVIELETKLAETVCAQVQTVSVCHISEPRIRGRTKQGLIQSAPLKQTNVAPHGATTASNSI